MAPGLSAVCGISTPSSSAFARSTFAATPQVMQIRLNSAFANCTFGCPEGVQTEAVEFRRAETGVTPMWTTMRFPGQQYDEETDFFSNNHRFYNPSVPGQYLQPEPMYQSAWHVVAVAKGGRTPPLYSYAYDNPLYYADESGLFALKGKCTNWEPALREAKKRAGCGSGAGGENDGSCACTKKLNECKATSGCDICRVLDNAEEATIVENLKCRGLEASGCSNRNSKGYFGVQFDLNLCSPPADPSDLATVILHEAAHHCRDQTKKHVPDDKSKCSAQAIAEACR